MRTSFAFGIGVEENRGALLAISAWRLVSLASNPTNSSTSLSASENTSGGESALCQSAITNQVNLTAKCVQQNGFILRKAGSNDVFQ